MTTSQTLGHPTEDDLYTVREVMCRSGASLNPFGLIVLEVCDTCGEAVEATIPGRWYPLWLCWSCLMRKLVAMDEFDRAFMAEHYRVKHVEGRLSGGKLVDSRHLRRMLGQANRRPQPQASPQRGVRAVLLLRPTDSRRYLLASKPCAHSVPRQA